MKINCRTAEINYMLGLTESILRSERQLRAIRIGVKHRGDSDYLGCLSVLPLIADRESGFSVNP